MSVLANTLNAYAAKLKAQRKAAEREAQAQARAKSVEQRLADKMRIDAERLQKIKREHTTPATEFMSDFYLDLVVRRFKNDLSLALHTGERAQITRDLRTIVDLYFYTGTIPGTKAYKVIDTGSYSETAFEIMVSVIANMRMAKADDLCDVIKSKFRKIVLFKTNAASVLTFTPSHISLDDIKIEFDKMYDPDFEGQKTMYAMR